MTRVARASDLTDDGVIGGGDFVEDAVDALQLLLVLDGDAVVGLVVVLHGTTQLPVGQQMRALVK